MTSPIRSQPATCGNCEHSLVMTGVPQFDYTGPHFLCGYESPLDSNLPGEVVGLTNFRPEWCPVKVALIQREIEVQA